MRVQAEGLLMTLPGKHRVRDSVRQFLQTPAGSHPRWRSGCKPPLAVRMQTRKTGANAWINNLPMSTMLTLRTVMSARLLRLVCWPWEQPCLTGRCDHYANRTAAMYARSLWFALQFTHDTHIFGSILRTTYSSVKEAIKRRFIRTSEQEIQTHSLIASYYCSQLSERGGASAYLTVYYRDIIYHLVRNSYLSTPLYYLLSGEKFLPLHSIILPIIWWEIHTSLLHYITYYLVRNLYLSTPLYYLSSGEKFIPLHSIILPIIW